MRPNDAYFDLLIETLAGLDSATRAQFLHRFFQSLSQLDIPEAQAAALWDEVVARRTQLSERSGSPIAFQTALVDVLAATGKFRLPVVLEYEELKNLQRTAVTDPLTGLNNRRLFDATVDKELNRARRYAHSLSLVILDLHRFKEVNDQYGHPRGDEVLHAAAATFKKALRTSDSAFRIGGDEFALILPQTDSVQASALSRRIGIVFSELLRPLDLGIRVSIDHGVATYPQDGDLRERLVGVADERLYHFKHAEKQGSPAPESPAGAAPTVGETPSADARTATVSREEQPPETTPSAGVAAAESAEKPQAIPAEQAAPAAPSPAEVEKAVEAAVPEAPSPSPLPSSKPVFPLVPEEPHLYAVPRKAERVSMSGTNAYAVLGDQPSNRARVVDLGFGGVALDIAASQEILSPLLAVLHVPILPPVRVSLKAVWSKPISEDTVRVGCCFIS